MDWKTVNSNLFELDVAGIFKAHIKYAGNGWVLILGNSAVPKNYRTPELAQDAFIKQLKFKLRNLL